MIQLKISIPLARVGDGDNKFSLINYYLWQTMFLNIQLKIIGKKLYGTRIKFKTWTVLTSPRGHKQGQHGLQIRNRKILVAYYLENCRFYKWWGVLTCIRNYVIFYNLFFKSHNCYLVNINLQVQLYYSILRKVNKMITIFLLCIYLWYIWSNISIIIFFVIFWLVLISGFIQIMIFTTCERKILALIQRRVGPRIIGIQGRLQYLADSLKLLTKVFTGPRRINAAMFQGAAFGGFWLSWINYSNITYGPGMDIIEIEYNIFFMICISLAFSLIWLLAGWAATSKYSLLGSLRAAVQIISFEAIMSLVLLLVFIILNSFNYEIFAKMQSYIAVIFFSPIVVIILLFAFFMETNRPPFDLSEAESDIVAGYNVEYSGILFGLFYLGEYLNLFVACLIVVISMGGAWNNWWWYIYYINKIILNLVI